MSLKKIIQNIIISFLSIFLFIGILIVSIAFYGNRKIHYEVLELKRHEHVLFDWDSLLGYKLRPNSKCTQFDLSNPLSGIKRNKSDSLIFYTSDSLGRRLIPRHTLSYNHLLFFGCSFTYGDGVSDQNTYPYLYSLKDSLYNVYNYALSGYATQHMYELLKRGILSDINESRGTAIYMFIDNHKDRVSYDPYTMSWGYNFMQYIIDDHKKLLLKGSFYNSDPFMTCFWKGVGSLNLWPILIPVFKVVYKEDVSNMDNERYELVAKLILESKRIYLKKFPQGRFVTAIFPGESTNILPYLLSEEIEVMNLSDSVNLREINGIQKDGYHPNEAGNEKLAEIIYNYLH